MKTLFRLTCFTLGLAAVALAPRAYAEATAPDATATVAETQTGKVYRALRDLDWMAWYNLVAFSEKLTAELKDKGTTPEMFAADMQKGYESSFKTPEEKKVTDDIFKSIKDIMVGEAVISGDTAVVPTSATISSNGQARAFKGTAHLIRRQGTWKLDLTFSDDSEQAMAQRVGEIFGKPVAAH